MMDKDKRLMEASWWERLTEGETGFCLMDGAMLSKSLIQFYVNGWSCVPSLLFTWGQTMVEVMKIMVTSLKRSHACTATVCAPNPMPLLEAPGHTQSSLLWGHCSFLQGPVAQGSAVPSKSPILPSPITIRTSSNDYKTVI